MASFHDILQVSSSSSKISVPRLSVGAVSSRPSTPTLGKATNTIVFIV